MSTADTLSNEDANFLVAILGVLAAFSVVILIIAVVCYVLQALGFYKLTQNRNLPHAWIAWIPVCQNYLLGELIGNKVWGIGYANWILLVGNVCASLISTYLKDMTNETLVLVLSLLVLVFAVYQFTAYYKLFKIYTDHPVAWLILSIVIPVSAPFIVFFIRNKEPKPI